MKILQRFSTWGYGTDLCWRQVSFSKIINISKIRDFLFITLMFLAIIDLVKKGMTKWIFSISHIFWKMYPDSKQDIRKSWDLRNVLYKYAMYCTVWGSERFFFFFWKMCNIEVNTEILNILPFLIVLTTVFHK